MEVLFIRHGFAKSNIYDPDMKVGSDLELTDEGVEQATAIAESLADLAMKGIIGPVEHIYSSPYVRARHTADIIAAKFKMPYTIDFRLGEIHKGSWHGLRVEDVMKWEAEVATADRPSHRPPGGESPLDVANRTTDFISEVEAQGVKSIIVVSHNHPIEACIGQITGLDPSEWERRPVDNASLCRVVKLGDFYETDERYYNYHPSRG